VAGNGENAKRRSSHRVSGSVLVFLGALLIAISTISLWVRDVALDSDTWESSSVELLQSEDVRDVLAAYLVDEAYASSDFQSRLEEALPPNLSPLAAPIAAQLQARATEIASQALERPRVQEAWRSANRAVHERLVAVLEDDSERLRIEGDAVVLDLSAIVADVSQRIGAGERATAVVEERVEPIVVMRSDQLETAQSGVRFLKALSFWPFLIGLILWAAAIYLAHGRRRETVRAIAISLIAIGVVILVARRVGGNVFVDSLVKAESVRPAAHDVWTVLTQLLADSAVAGIVAGILGLVWTWASGPTRAAVRIRHWLAPTFRDRPLVVHGALASVILLLLLVGPVGAPRRLLSVLLLMILAFVGLELLRRQGVREFPNAVPGEAGSLRSAFAGRRAGGTQERERTAVVERLERLAALHEKGALSDEEYAAEKALLLG
jgi:hypothetical protein